MRFDPWLLCFPLACLLLGCGGDPSSDGEGGAASPESPFTGPHFAIEGHGESERLSAVLDVVEGQETSRLAITGFDAEENLVAIYVTFHGTGSVVGSHVLPIGPIDAEVFAVGTIGGRAYQSQSGELRVNMSSDRFSEGEFEAALVLDETSPLTLPPGAPEPTVPAPAELTLAGTFASEWRVNCRSYISGFTGGHAVSDSPYCTALTF
jgi:hypothetical protein